MKFIENVSNYKTIKSADLFIVCLGYEDRSHYILEKALSEDLIEVDKIICFDFVKDDGERWSSFNYKEHNIQNIYEIRYEDKSTIKKALEHISNSIEGKYNVQIDFSSMPRSFYAELPYILNGLIHTVDGKVTFLYSHGDYSDDVEHMSTADVEDFHIFKGKASLDPQNRSHILGLGYNSVRTQAIRCVMDPSNLISCYSYPKGNDNIKKTILSQNEEILLSSSLVIGLPMLDFKFCLNKLIEIVSQLLRKGDVVIIPEGPKTQIMACSLVPYFLKRKVGLICFHVKSNSVSKPENIKATGVISGFSLSKNF